MPETDEPTPPQCFTPQDTDALWKLVTTPHPVVGKARHLGEALLHAGIISESALISSLQAQRSDQERGIRRQIGQILVEQGDVTQEQIKHVIGSWLGEYMVNPGHLTPDAVSLALVPRAVAERESVLPLLAREDALVLLMADPYDRVLLDELRFLTQRRLIPLQAAPGTLMPAISKAYSVHLQTPASTPPGAGAHRPSVPTSRATSQELAVNLTTTAPDSESEQTDVISESDNTLVRLINSVIDEAINHRASDIHIETEPAPQNVRVRLRIDGELTPYLELPARFRFAMVARIKIMASMDISEHRKPQDGKIDFSRFGGPPVELRVVTVPTSRGLEDVVLRLLAGAKPLPLEAIGLSPANLVAIRGVMKKSYGLVLVVGPTGCGKTTSLHSVIRDINTAGRKIWTAEDPIEITQSGLRQVQVNARIGWTFAAAMRTFLRADPDVIMIGEMRDEETRAHRHRGLAHGAPGAVHTAHQFGAREHCAAARNRAGPVQLLGLAAGHSCPAPGAAPVHRLPRAPVGRRGSPERSGLAIPCQRHQQYARGALGAGGTLAQTAWRRHGCHAAVARGRLQGVREPRLPRTAGHP
ncbi:UNVERIFIED_CONTAM: type II secretion system (T2SS) protein E [Acidovorax defluvii]